MRSDAGPKALIVLAHEGLRLRLGLALAVACAAGSTAGPSFAAETLTPEAMADVVASTVDHSASDSLPAFWAEAFEGSLGRDYRDPTMLAWTGEAVPGNRCGVDEDIIFDNALYCPADEAIIYDAGFLASMHEAFGPSAVIGLVAHEWGHHLQSLATRPVLSLRAELQADCYAGVYIGHLVDAGVADVSDVLDSLAATESLGDDAYGPLVDTEWFDPGLHGDRHERRQAFGIGYSTGDPLYCRAYQQWTPQPPTELIGPGSSGTWPEITLPPGSFETVRGDGTRIVPTPGGEVAFWLFELDPGTSALDAIGPMAKAVLRPAEVEVSDLSSGWLDVPLWSDGQGARAFLTRTTPDGANEEGAAALQVHDDGDAELFVAFGDRDARDGAALSAYRAIDALSWGYCDRWAYVTDNCAPLTDEEITERPVPLPSARPVPEDELPRPLPRPTSRPD